jgi:phosphate transport system substrate-binding protein
MNRLFFIIALFVSFLLGANELSATDLLGAGATFPYPFYSKIFKQYYAITGNKINYQAIGSGGGIRQLIAKTVDFGATDAFMTKKEMLNAKQKIIHIPTCLGAVAITYNLPGNPKIKLTGKIIADIFLGKIRKWNAPEILNINKGIKIPALNILPVHRSDGSGTTFIFTDYLSKVSELWKKSIGAGKVIKWKSGIGAKGNAGVSGSIKNIPGSIGYVEFIYAISNKMPVAMIKNNNGEFVVPNIESISKAAQIKIPDDTRLSITNSKAMGAYPISGFTWIIFFKNQANLNKAIALKKLLLWIMNDGQKYAKTLHYAPLPKNAKKTAIIQINKMLFNGKKIEINK